MEKSVNITTMPFYKLEQLTRVARRASYFCNKTLPIELYQKIDTAVNSIESLFKEFSEYEKSQEN